METIPPWLGSGIKLLLWWGALCSLLLLLIIARQCNTYRIATFGAHRISQTIPTAPTDVKNSKVTAKPLLFTPTAQQLRFAVAIDTTGEEKSTLTIADVSLTDNRKKQYRFPTASIGNLNMWEQESLEPALLQDGKTALVMLFFAPPVPDEAGLEFFRLKFVATLEHVGKKNKQVITKYPFQLDIKKAEIERLHAFNLMPRATGMHDGVERFKAHIRHFRRDLAGTVYVHFVSIWGALGTLLAAWLFFKWRAQVGERRYSGSHLDDWEPRDQRRAVEGRMKHYRLAFAIIFLCGAGISGIVFLAKAINKYGSRPVTQPTPVVFVATSFTPVPIATSTPSPTPLPTPASAPVPYVKQIGDREWRVFVPIEAGWFDTGIPVITNNELIVSSPTGRWQVQLGQNSWFSTKAWFQPGQGLSFMLSDSKRSMTCCIDYDFHETVKLRVDEEGGERAINFFVSLRDLGDDGRDDPTHMALHRPYIEWFNQKLKLVQRPIASTTPEPVSTP